MGINQEIRELRQAINSIIDDVGALVLRVSKLENATLKAETTPIRSAAKRETNPKVKNPAGISETSARISLNPGENKQSKQKRRPRRKKQKVDTHELQRDAKISEGNPGHTSLSKIFDDMQHEDAKMTENKRKNDSSPTDVIALDCEMVGVGPNGRQDMLARVSAVDMRGNVVYDEYVLPKAPVTDYRTKVSGIRPEHLKRGLEPSVVREEMAAILKNRIVVGHSLYHDFGVLSLHHPRRLRRDTSYYRPYCNLFGGRTPSLKNLAQRVLNLKIQEGEHSSVQDAQVAMKLYLHQRQKWENQLRQSSGSKRRGAQN